MIVGRYSNELHTSGVGVDGVTRVSVVREARVVVGLVVEVVVVVLCVVVVVVGLKVQSPEAHMHAEIKLQVTLLWN